MFFGTAVAMDFATQNWSLVLYHILCGLVFVPVLFNEILNKKL